VLHISVIMSYYTIDDFKNLMFNGMNMKLDEPLVNILKELSRKLVASDGDGDDTNYQKITRHNDKRNDNHQIKRGYHNKTRDCDGDWKTTRNFKKTIIEKKQGIEKKINEIRTALNKFSVKNKEELTLKIINLIDEVTNDENENEKNENDKNENDENMNKIIGFIFNIASSNAFFSEIYAELYMTLMNKYSIFGSKIIDLIENYKNSYNEIKPVDPNKDYDGYCGYVKENDNRKAMTTFMCYLTKYKVLDGDTLLSITDYITYLIPSAAESDNTTSVVDEYCDNLYIIVTTAYALFRNNKKFKTVTVEKLKEITRLRKTDIVRYKSMSSRATYKIMDLLDYIKKH
jgi:hypothetical protein